jgi:hypothetical protein
MLQAPMIMEEHKEGVEPREEGQWVGETKNHVLWATSFPLFFFLFFLVAVLINEKLKDPESPDPRTARP